MQAEDKTVSGAPKTESGGTATDVQQNSVSLENDIAVLVNEYFTLYRNICERYNVSSHQLTKTFLSIKSTERDEMRLSLLNSIRGAFLTIENEHDQFTLKENESVQLSNKGKTDQLNVYNPMKLIHGGFTPLSLRECHLTFKDIIPLLLELHHLRRKIYTLIDEIDLGTNPLNSL